MMKILVLGGSYFLGKAFVNLVGNELNKKDIINEDWHITVLNRGNRPLDIENIEQLRMDRHDEAALRGLSGRHFDVVVDFCAYEAQDIRLLYEKGGISTEQYILISTVDVYRRNTGICLDEAAEYETRQFAGPQGAYISGKIDVEKELIALAEQEGFRYTIFRPAIIYGPDNYAPRESIYLRWITEAGQILHPVDATGHFQLVYVGDVAKAIMLAMGNAMAYNRCFNLCGKELVTYDSWYETLKKLFSAEAGLSFERIDVPVETVIEKNIPLPFPLLKEESEWYDGSAVESMGLNYTDLYMGLKYTFGMI